MALLVAACLLHGGLYCIKSPGVVEAMTSYRMSHLVCWLLESFGHTSNFQAEGFDPVAAGRSTGTCRMVQLCCRQTLSFPLWCVVLLEQGFDFDIRDFCDPSERCASAVKCIQLLMDRQPCDLCAERTTSAACAIFPEGAKVEATGFSPQLAHTWRSENICLACLRRRRPNDSATKTACRPTSSPTVQPLFGLLRSTVTLPP